ncbi:MAG TPA: serine/threonine protein kinase, partial [Polyangiales bacterium]|nr:serine/threonine protein kinase [Polyangiales bacterium]
MSPKDVANRYQTFGEIASGGMATVEYGRLLGPHGFSRPVAIKRLHAQFAKDPAFAAMFIDEARLSARLTHANIVQTLDVIE